MNRKDYTREILNLTQEEMATLLGTTRSHYSVYELGLRELPSKASRRLTEIDMLLFGVDRKVAKVDPEFEKLDQLKEAMLLKAIRKNEDDLYVLREKITETERRHKGALETLELIGLLELSENTKAEPLFFKALPIIQYKASKKLQHNSSELLMDLQMQLHKLEHEEQYLADLLRKHKSDKTKTPD